MTAAIHMLTVAATAASRERAAPDHHPTFHPTTPVPPDTFHRTAPVRSTRRARPTTDKFGAIGRTYLWGWVFFLSEKVAMAARSLKEQILSINSID